MCFKGDGNIWVWNTIEYTDGLIDPESASAMVFPKLKYTIVKGQQIIYLFTWQRWSQLAMLAVQCGGHESS